MMDTEKMKLLAESLDESERRILDIKNDGYLFDREWIQAEVDRTGKTKYTVSCAKLAKYVKDSYHVLYIQGAGSRPGDIYIYNDKKGVYECVYDDYIRGIIKNNIPLLIQKASDVDNTYKLFKADKDITLIPRDRLNSNEHIINFQNGLLDLREMKLFPHTPEELSTIQLPLEYDDNNRECPIFDNFLDTLTNGDDKSKKVILQFMGLALSNMNVNLRAKKALFIVGKGNTGKSQISLLLRKLLGCENVASTTLARLEKNRFEAAKLFCKRLAGDDDMSFCTLSEMSVFKQLTGGDTISGEYKCGALFDFAYKGLLLFCSNDLPSFGGDRGEHVYERIAIIPCVNVIPEDKQDKYLLDKLYKERAGIVNKAIHELILLKINRFKFDLSEKSVEMLKNYRTQNSTVLSFISECCKKRNMEIGRVDNITKGALYRYYKLWCKENTNIPVSNQKFRKEIVGYYGNDVVFRNKDNAYYIFTLKDKHREENSRHYGNC